ncbi:hypothetical protein SDC9_109864 [bioreactor metagenome]|uniref:Uncharacterized protein n=1 Tax=bioreactor metagenome TaxID=1076179 RepID=A0A645BD17_9ZZZZ
MVPYGEVTVRVVGQPQTFDGVDCRHGDKDCNRIESEFPLPAGFSHRTHIDLTGGAVKTGVFHVVPVVFGTGPGGKIDFLWNGHVKYSFKELAVLKKGAGKRSTDG